MKKILPLILPVFIFIPALLYLHQKVQLYVEAYRLSNTFSYHKELVDKRDYLMYNFAKEATLAKVNKWASLKDFTPVEKGRVMALDIKKQIPIARDNKVVLLLDRILRASTSTSTALAKEKR
ncbi:MAG: hypothetical protein HQ570_01585 [Candidatus Omnitrophica bacterium]|nr:hypothetical protein [Candidatus Omnitrophota bacterium]